MAKAAHVFCDDDAEVEMVQRLAAAERAQTVRAAADLAARLARDVQANDNATAEMREEAARLAAQLERDNAAAQEAAERAAKAEALAAEAEARLAEGEGDFEESDSDPDSIKSEAESEVFIEHEGEEDWDLVRVDKDGKYIAPPPVRNLHSMDEVWLEFKQSPKSDTFRFLKLIWPMASATEISVFLRALQKMECHNEVFRAPWYPLRREQKEPLRDENGKIIPECPVSLTQQVPEEWGTADGMNYIHGTCGYNLPKIRRDGLTGAAGAENWYKRAVYTCKRRYTPFHQYATPFVLQFPGYHPRTYKCCLGLHSLLPDPFHSGKATRSNLDYHQYYFRQDTFRVAWAEFICVDGDPIFVENDPELTSRDVRRMNARADQANAMLTRLSNAQRVDLASPPPERVRKTTTTLARYKAPSPPAWQQRWQKDTWSRRDASRWQSYHADETPSKTAKTSTQAIEDARDRTKSGSASGSDGSGWIDYTDNKYESVWDTCDCACGECWTNTLCRRCRTCDKVVCMSYCMRDPRTTCHNCQYGWTKCWDNHSKYT